MTIAEDKDPKERALVSLAFGLVRIEVIGKRSKLAVILLAAVLLALLYGAELVRTAKLVGDWVGPPVCTRSAPG